MTTSNEERMTMYADEGHGESTQPPAHEGASTNAPSQSVAFRAARRAREGSHEEQESKARATNAARLTLWTAPGRLPCPVPDYRSRSVRPGGPGQAESAAERLATGFMGLAQALERHVDLPNHCAALAVDNNTAIRLTELLAGHLLSAAQLLDLLAHSLAGEPQAPEFVAAVPKANDAGREGRWDWTIHLTQSGLSTYPGGQDACGGGVP